MLTLPFQFEAHSVILRLNGFDCSMNFKSCDIQSNPASGDQGPHSADAMPTNHFLLPPPSSAGCLARKGYTGSFNCLRTTSSSSSSGGGGGGGTFTISGGTDPNSLSPPMAQQQQHGLNSSSDSDLRYCNSRKEVFNFTSPLPMTPTTAETMFRGPLSPRIRCGTPTSCLDTPPTSPLTPISILYNLPYAMLTPITYWLYSESLPPKMSEEICGRLIQLGEQTPPLNKIVQPCKKYLQNLNLKKCK